MKPFNLQPLILIMLLCIISCKETKTTATQSGVVVPDLASYTLEQDVQDQLYEQLSTYVYTRRNVTEGPIYFGEVLYGIKKEGQYIQVKMKYTNNLMEDYEVSAHFFTNPDSTYQLLNVRMKRTE